MDIVVGKVYRRDKSMSLENLNDALGRLLGSFNYNPDQSRDDRGRWASAGAAPKSGSGKTLSYGERRLVGGKKLPPHVAALAIPPGWKDVQVNLDKNSSTWVKGKDSKGKTQIIQNPDVRTANAAKNMAVAKDAIESTKSILEENEKNMSHIDPQVRDNANVLKTIIHTGIRPGTDWDTGADHKAYGATTLLGKHVVTKGGETSLQFVPGKSQGNTKTFPISDPDIAKMLKDKAKASGPNGKLFDTTALSLRKYTAKLGDGSFTPKNFRTAGATSRAIAKINQMDKAGKTPQTMAEYKKAVMHVAGHVGEWLQDTPQIALKSYIAPEVFLHWKPMK